MKKLTAILLSISLVLCSCGKVNDPIMKRELIDQSKHEAPPEEADEQKSANQKEKAKTIPIDCLDENLEKVRKMFVTVKGIKGEPRANINNIKEAIPKDTCDIVKAWYWSDGIDKALTEKPIHLDEIDRVELVCLGQEVNRSQTATATPDPDYEQLKKDYTNLEEHYNSLTVAFGVVLVAFAVFSFIITYLSQKTQKNEDTRLDTFQFQIVPNIAGIIHIEPNTEERMAFLREDIVRAEYPDLDQTITEREERIHYLDEQIGIKKVKKRQLKVASHRLDVDILDRQNDLREVLREVNDAKIVRNRLADDITSLRAKLEEYDE